MNLLNYIYFLIITALGFIYLFSPQHIVLHPYKKDLKLNLNGPEMFWFLTFSTGLLAFSVEGGLNLMAVRLFVIEIFLVTGLFITKNRIMWNTPVVLYTLYILWLIIGTFYSPAPEYGIRVILKYMYPFLILIFSSSVVRDGELFMKASIGARTMALISLLLIVVPFLEKLIPGVFWYVTARAINYISMFIFSLALYFYGTRSKKDLLIAILFMLPCFIWVFRTSIVGTIIAFIAFLFVHYKLKSLPLIGIVLALSISSIFLVPSIRDKTFYDTRGKNIESLQEGKIKQDEVNTNGRLAMWEWSLYNNFKSKEITGSGTGNLQRIFYSGKHPFGDLKVCHNDYVQILCDNGLIGLLLFGSSFLSIIIHSLIVSFQKKYPWYIHIAAVTAFASTLGVIFTLYTDNVINYSMATISYPCGFYGMMCGLISSYKRETYRK